MKTIAKLFCGNVKRRRKELGLTQADVAERTELSLTGYQQVESGACWIGKDTPARLAKALETTEVALFQDASYEAEVTPKKALLVLQKAIESQSVPIYRDGPFSDILSDLERASPEKVAVVRQVLAANGMPSVKKPSKAGSDR